MERAKLIFPLLVFFILFLPIVAGVINLTSIHFSSKLKEIPLSYQPLDLIEVLKKGVLELGDKTFYVRVKDVNKNILSVEVTNKERNFYRYFLFDLNKISLAKYLPASRYFVLADSEGNVYKFYVKNEHEEIVKFLKNAVEEKGYIIEFKEQPLLLKKLSLQKEIEREKVQLLKNKSLTLVEIKEIEDQLEKNLQQKIKGYKLQLETAHKKAKEEIEKLLGKKQTEIKSFTHIFNGIAIKSNEVEIEKIKQLPYVKRISEDRKVHLLLNESVPLINAARLWYELDSQGRNITGKGIKIAIIDTGVDYTHPDLGGGCFGSNCKVIGGWDFINNDSYPMDDHGHGTHVASIAAGNGKLKGVAPEANILAYKVLDESGGGDESDVIEAVEKAIEDGANVISMSLGISYYWFEDCYDITLSTVVDNAVEAGVVVVVAAGNEGPEYQTIAAPGCAEKVITVGASYKRNYQAFWWNCTPGVITPCGICGKDGKVFCDYWGDGNPVTDQVVAFSSRGPTLARERIIKPDVVAPGAIICAARYDEIFPTNQHPYYYPCVDEQHVQLAGTSMATPHVSGLVALLLQSYPNWKPNDIKSAIMLAAKDIGYDVVTQGAGRVNVTKTWEIPVLTYPQSIWMDLIKTPVNSTVIGIKNLKNYPITINFILPPATSIEGGNFDIAKLNVSSIQLQANGKAAVLFTIDLTSLSGTFFGKIILSVGSENYTIPYAALRLVEVNVSAVANDIQLYPDLCIYDDEGKIVYYKTQLEVVGNSYTFLLSPGRNYTACGIGDWLNESLNYILVNRSYVGEESITIFLNLSEARAFNVRAKSLDNVDLKLYEWEWGFLSYINATKFIVGASFEDYTGVIGDRIIYLSDKPVSPFHTDIILRYTGVPVRR